MTFLLRLGKGAVYCDQLVCLSVSVREYISETAGPIVAKFFVQIPCGCGSVLLWRHCDMLCTSGFMDDVTFGCSGPYGDAWLATLRWSTRAESDVYECLVNFGKKHTFQLDKLADSLGCGNAKKRSASGGFAPDS